MRTASIRFNYVLSHKMRFEGKHYLNDNALSCMSIENNSSKCFCLDDIADVFNPPVFKRQFCKQSGNSVMYFQSSDVSTASETSPVFINKKQVESLNLLVRKNDILITGFGTIGNVRLVSRLQDGVCYANNVCRVRVKDGVCLGYIYAFLSSKYAYSQLNNNASGSVVRYIEAPGVKKTLVPNFPNSFQKEVDDLIQESARLREEAAEALEDAIAKFDTYFPNLFIKKQIGVVSSKDILISINKRMEGTFHISEGKDIDKYIKEHFEWKPLGDVCSSISRPDIFKRYYVKKGITFLGGADIFLATPDSNKKLSIAKTDNINALIIKEGTILMPRSGTIGNVAWAHAGHAQKLASEHVIRLLPNDILMAGYIYAFLASKYGKLLIHSYIFGSVIQHIEPPHLKLIPIPILEEVTMNVIHEKVMRYSTSIGCAIENERKAIRMVEEEIEKWNK